MSLSFIEEKAARRVGRRRWNALCPDHVGVNARCWVGADLRKAQRESATLLICGGDVVGRIHQDRELLSQFKPMVKIYDENGNSLKPTGAIGHLGKALVWVIGPKEYEREFIRDPGDMYYFISRGSFHGRR